MHAPPSVARPPDAHVPLLNVTPLLPSGAFAVLGMAMLPLLPISIETGVECSYPVPEIYSSGLLLAAGTGPNPTKRIYVKIDPAKVSHHLFSYSFTALQAPFPVHSASLMLLFLQMAGRQHGGHPVDLPVRVPDRVGHGPVYASNQARQPLCAGHPTGHRPAHLRLPGALPTARGATTSFRTETRLEEIGGVQC